MAYEGWVEGTGPSSALYILSKGSVVLQQLYLHLLESPSVQNTDHRACQPLLPPSDFTASRTAHSNGARTGSCVDQHVPNDSTRSAVHLERLAELEAASTRLVYKPSVYGQLELTMLCLAC